MTFIEPMNAKLATPEKVTTLLNDDGYIGEVKYDGYRAVWDGEKLYSRLGNAFSVTEIKAALPKGIVLDGELYIPGGISSDVTTALGKDGDKGKLKYIVYDVLAYGGNDLLGWSWEDRRTCLDSMPLSSDKVSVSTVYVDKFGLNDYSAAMDFIKGNNIEGVMLKNVHALYLPGKRPSNNWWKVKRALTYDVIILSFSEGKGKYAGLVGSINFGLYKEGKLTFCGSCSGMDDAMRKRMAENKEKFIGRVMEIHAMQREEKTGFFRHPTFKQLRDEGDKSPRQCTWEQ